jgi:hypothetical protein
VLLCASSVSDRAQQVQHPPQQLKVGGTCPEAASVLLTWCYGLPAQVVYQPYLQEFLSVAVGNSSSTSGASPGSGDTSIAAFADVVFDALSPDTLHMGEQRLCIHQPCMQP